MTANPFPFQVLFCFENDSKIIAEIKRTDIRSDDKSQVYKWLLIQQEVSVLTFRSMSQNADQQQREFAEGILEWDRTTAYFNGEPMTPIAPHDLSGESVELILHFLQERKQA